MTNSQHKKSTLRLLDMAGELVEIFNKKPHALPKKDYKNGQNLVSVFENPQFTTHFQNLAQLKEKLYKDCLIDISEGGEGFKTGVYSIYFEHGQLQTCHKLFGDTRSGELVFSVGLKSFMAFQGFKEKEADELAQDDINCLSVFFIYALATF